MAARREKVEAGSGDVFVDLGFADARERRMRVQLAMQINERIAARGLTQTEAAALFSVPRQHVSHVKNYKLGRMSSERLQRLLSLI
jgi:predicted XRE-type DNA-binding protein